MFNKIAENLIKNILEKLKKFLVSMEIINKNLQ